MLVPNVTAKPEALARLAIYLHLHTALRTNLSLSGSLTCSAGVSHVSHDLGRLNEQAFGCSDGQGAELGGLGGHRSGMHRRLTAGLLDIDVVTLQGHRRHVVSDPQRRGVIVGWQPQRNRRPQV